jgi:hypothetical protein
MGLIPLLKPGTWYIVSKSDPRWQASGRSEMVGGFAMPDECREAINKKKRELGTDPPKDLEWGYMKD